MGMLERVGDGPGVVFVNWDHEKFGNGYKDNVEIVVGLNVFDAKAVDGYADVVVITGEKFSVVHGGDNVGDAGTVGDSPSDDLSADFEIPMRGGVLEEGFA